MSFKKSGLLRCALTLIASAAALAAPLAAQAAVQQERVVVVFKDGGATAARAAVARAGGRVVLDLSEVNAFAVRLPSNAVAALKRDRNLESVEADPLRHLMGKPEKALRGVKPASVSTEQVPYGIPMVQADQVTFNPNGGRKLCIIDAGFDISHEDLQKTNVSGIDLTTTQLGDWDTDENSHGTHVAGTIAALGGNGVGVVGVVPTGTLPLYIAKVFDASGSASSSAILKGVLNCRKAGANVISMSLGGGAPNNFEAKIYDFVSKKGVLIIAAAGNAGDTSISYPAGYASVMSVAAIDENKARASFSQQNADVEIAGPGVGTLSTVPPGIESAGSLTVGAGSYAVLAMAGSPRLTVTAPLANFGLGDTPVAGSMTGKVCLISRGTISFADKVLNCQASGGTGAVIYNNATGELNGTMNGVVTTIPSVGALQADGASMLTQVGTSATVSVFSDPAKYAYFSGTSMATPHVSGVAALVWSNFPACGPARIREALTASAMDLGAAGRDIEFGFGLVQAKAAVTWLTTYGCTAAP